MFSNWMSKCHSSQNLYFSFAKSGLIFESVREEKLSLKLVSALLSTSKLHTVFNLSN